MKEMSKDYVPGQEAIAEVSKNSPNDKARTQVDQWDVNRYCYRGPSVPNSDNMNRDSKGEY